MDENKFTEIKPANQVEIETDRQSDLMVRVLDSKSGDQNFKSLTDKHLVLYSPWSNSSAVLIYG